MEATRGAPFVVVINKVDLIASWDIDARLMASLEGRGWLVQRASAKTGEGVQAAFDLLVDSIVDRRGAAWI